MIERIVKIKDVFPKLPKAVARRNVAAYARVSTGSFEQENSLDAQKDFYEKYIRRHEHWNFIGLYVDDGISGLGTNRRDGFNDMIRDALSGKIDLIITKSISRFARNTVDTLTIIRQLKAAGIEVYFQKEDVYTFESKGEFVLSLMSCFAQEESRSISENVKWGWRKAFSDGKYSVAYKTFLGYDKGDDQPLKINEEEEKIVRLIYILYLEGNTTYGIAKLLTSLSIPTPGGKEKWTPTVVGNILTNEKYKGDALLQKKFTVDYLTKKKIKNEGQLPQYYVTDGHPAIIPKDIHEYVAAQVKKRHDEYGRSYSSVNPFSGKIACCCGDTYRIYSSNHNTKYSYFRWACKSNSKDIRHSPAIRTDILNEIVRLAFVELLTFKTQIIEKSFDTVDEYIIEMKQSGTVYNRGCIEDLVQTLPSEEICRILIKRITIDDNKSVVVEFINGFRSTPKTYKKKHQ